MKRIRRLFKSFLSLLIVAVMVFTNPLLVLADAIHVDTLQVEGTRLGEDELIEGNLVYFGTTNVSVREGNAIYRIPVYRAGDLSQPADVLMHTLDVSALYGKDYVLLGKYKKEYKSEKTLMEMAVTGETGQPEEVTYELDEYGNINKKEVSGVEGISNVAIATDSDYSGHESSDLENGIAEIYVPEEPDYVDDVSEVSEGNEALEAEPGDCQADTLINEITEAVESEEIEYDSAVSLLGSQMDVEEVLAVPEAGIEESDLLDGDVLIEDVSTVVEMADEESDSDVWGASYEALGTEDKGTDFGEPGLLGSYSVNGLSDGKSRLAMLKEQETGKPTRESVSTDVTESLTEALLGQILPEKMLNIRHSCEQVIHFEAGSDESYMEFRIYDDAVSEGSETFSIMMMSAEGAEPYLATSLSVIIEDDEETVHSTLSFDKNEYYIVNGTATVTVERTDAIYSMATANLTGKDLGTEETKVYGTVVFSPYEEKKEIKLYLDTATHIELTDFMAAEAGAITAAEIKVDKNGLFLGTGTIIDDGNLLGDVQGDNKEFTITINDKKYTVEYQKGKPTGDIYDKSYDPALKVGLYIFSASTDKNGLFEYSSKQVTGDIPKPCGQHVSEYVIDKKETDLVNGYGDIRYYATSAWKMGTSYAYIPYDKSPVYGIYTQFVTPYWESTSSIGIKGNEMDLYICNGTNSTSEAYHAKEEGKFSKKFSTDGTVKLNSVANRGRMGIRLSAEDNRSGYTPQSFMKFYGVAAFYKKFRISTNDPAKKTFKNGKSTFEYVPAQFKVKCGAQVPGNNYQRDIYAIPYDGKNGDVSAMVFSIEDVIINNATGKFGILKGYNITISPESKDDKVNRTYPDDFIRFLNLPNHYTVDILDYSSDAVKKEIEKVQSHLDTVTFDQYFLDWIACDQMTTIDESWFKKAYYQRLDFTPIVEYNDVKVTIEAPYAPNYSGSGLLAAFDDPDIKLKDRTAVTKTFHAGDTLDLTSTISDSNYNVVGYEVSIDGGDYNTIRDTYNLVLLPNKTYRIRPAVEEKKNCVEIIFKNGAEKLFSVENLIPQSDLAGHSDLVGRYFLDLHPEKKDIYDRMDPDTGVAASVKVIVTGKPSKSDNVYRPVFTDNETGHKYRGSEYDFILRSRSSDNIVTIDREEISKSDLKTYNFSGSIVTESASIRQEGLDKHSVPIEGYTVYMGGGEETVTVGGKKQTVVGTISSVVSSGRFELDGCTGRKDDVLTILVDNGFNDAQILEVKLCDAATSGSTDLDVGNLAIGYPAKVPYISSLAYDYDLDSSRSKADLLSNSVRMFDDNLSLIATVDRQGRDIEKVVYKVRTVNGDETEYEGLPDKAGGTVFTAKIKKMLTNLHNGDRIFCYLVDSEKHRISVGDDAEEIAIVYPTVETGLVTYIENELIAPKDFEVEKSADVDIPLIGQALGKLSSGGITLNRTDWPNNSGYSISVSLDAVIYDNKPSPTIEDKHKAFESFYSDVQDANNYKKEAVQYGKLAAEQAERQEQMLAKQRGVDPADLNNIERAKQLNLQMQKSADQDAKAAQGKLTKDAKMDFHIIYCMDFEFIFDPAKKEYILATAAVTAGGSFSISKTFYTMVYVVPCYLNLGLTVQANLTMGGVVSDAKKAYEAKDFDNMSGNLNQILGGNTFMAEFDFVSKGKVSIGAGMCGVLSVRGFVSLGVQFQFLDNHVASTWGGLLLDVAGGFGVDLLVGSIDIDVASVKQGIGSLASRTGISYFNNTLPGSENEDGGFEEVSDYSQFNYGEEYSVSGYDFGTADFSAFGKSASSNESDEKEMDIQSHLRNISITRLLENASDRTRPQIVDIGGGRKFLAFIGARSGDGDDSCLYYTVSDSLGNWAEPLPVADDMSFDSTPDVITDGNKVYIAWADGDGIIKNKEDIIKQYGSLGISAAIYDIASGSMGSEITLTADRDRGFCNLSPKLALADGKLYCTFMTRDVSKADDPKQLLDMEGQYSTMQIVTYDLSTGETGREYVIISHPTITDPLVMDYQNATVNIGGHDYLISAYTIDEDENLKTDTDRELYLGIRDITMGTDFFPIRLSDDDVPQTSPKLSVLPQGAFLTWIEDGKIFRLSNISDLLTSLFVDKPAAAAAYRADAQNEDWYVKEREVLGVDPEEYEGSIYQYLNEGKLLNDSVRLKKNEDFSGSIENYSLVTDGKDIYTFYTDLDSDEGTNGVELYGMVYTVSASDNVLRSADGEDDHDIYEEGGFSDPLEITDFDRVFDELDMLMDGSGNVYVVMNYFDEFINDDRKIEYSENTLAAMELGPDPSMEISRFTLNMPNYLVSGEKTEISFEVINRGLLIADGYDWKVSMEKNGSVKEIASGSISDRVRPGEARNVSAVWVDVPADLSDTNVIITVDEIGNGFASPSVQRQTVPYKQKLEMKSYDAAFNDGRVNVNARIFNKGNRRSDPCVVRLVNDDNEEQVFTMESIPSLGSGEEMDFSMSFVPKTSDWNDFGKISLKLIATDGEKELCTDYDEISSQQPVMIEINDGGTVIQLNSGESSLLSVSIVPWGTIANDLRFISSDPGVATVDENGVVRAVRSGRATITAVSSHYGISDTINVSVNGEYDDDDDSGYGGGKYRLPSWVVTSGYWRKNSNGTWNYVIGGREFKDEWLCVYNPYANVSKGQKPYGWFRFDRDGIMMNGWYTDTDGNVYYLNPISDNTQGMMLTGWQQIDGKWYYFSEAEGSGTMGALFRNSVTPDGYRVGADGVWIP